MKKWFFLYIIYSKKLDRYYIGQTSSLKNRLDKHLEGTTRYTKRTNDWVLVYSEAYKTRPEAMRREKFIKRMKSSKFIIELIAKAG